MADDARIALAFIAKRQGTDLMPAGQWAHVMSLELGWCGPAEAKAFVASCVASGALSESGDGLRPAFDWRSTKVPRGFRPDLGRPPPGPSITDAEDPFVALADEIAQAAQKDRGWTLDQVQEAQARFGGLLTAEAAAVLVGRTLGLDLGSAAHDAGERLKANLPHA